MATTLILIGIAIVLIAVLTCIVAPSVKGDKVKWGRAIACMVVALVLFVASACIYEVPSGYTGIKTTFGKVDNTSLPNGLNIVMPWQNVVLMDEHVQEIDIRQSDGDSAQTKDLQKVPTYWFKVQYQLRHESAAQLFLTYGTEYEDVLIRNNCLTVAKDIFPQYEAERIAPERDALSKQIEDELRERVAPYGIDIKFVNLKDYDFAPEFNKILDERALERAKVENNKIAQENARVTAQTEYDVAVKQKEKEAETQRIENEKAIAQQAAQNQILVDKARAEAERDKIAADNAAYVTTTKSEAEKTKGLNEAAVTKAKMEAENTTITDLMVQYEAAKRWDGKLIPSFGGSNGFTFTNLTDVIAQYLFPEAAPAAE